MRRRAALLALLGLLAALALYAVLGALLLGFVCGCAICYAAVVSGRLQAYVDWLKEYLLRRVPKEPPQYVQQRSCAACGAKSCDRHDPVLDLKPWAGLRIHKQLDQAIEDFYNAIIDNFISTWYSKITRQPFFMDELRQQLRYASAALLRRAYKINYSKLIIDKLIPCALHHHEIWMAAQRQRWRTHKINTSSSPEDYDDVVAEVEAAALAGPLRCGLHPAVGTRAAELTYLRCVTNAIMPYLLTQQQLQNRVFKVLIREIFAGWVLLSLTDVLADPYILNTLVVLALDDDTMAALPTKPNYRVEFLENFVRQSESVYARRSKLLKIDLEYVLTNQEYLYAFMQFMKTTGHFHLLQFCKDIKPFQMKILNPDLTANEQVSLFNEAWDLYMQYFQADSPAALPFEPALAEEMRSVLSEGVANVSKLQTSKALYQSSRYADSLLEGLFMPAFLHSEEFYKLFYGSRVPTGYHKQMTKKPQEKLEPLVSTAMKLGNKLKGALKPSSVDGQILDCLTNSEGGGEVWRAADDVDILKCLDRLAENARLEEYDLSGYDVALTRGENRQLESKRSPIRVFTISVERKEEASQWCVARTEDDFHLLRSKLTEFHGEGLLRSLQIPSRRDNSPIETLLYKYEDFIQRLLQNRLLITSELLYIFLTAKEDFGLALQRASLGGGGADLSNMYQSVAHKLRKEKGQHLEPFTSALLLSADLERYRAMKQGPFREVEEAEEVREEVHSELVTSAQHRKRRDIRNGTFGDNWAVERVQTVQRVQSSECAHQNKLAGFTQCLLFFLIKVIGARGVVCGVVACVGALFRDLIDHGFNLLLNSTLRSLLSHRRLAKLIRYGHELLFNHPGGFKRRPVSERRQRARELLHSSTPTVARHLLAPQLNTYLDNIVDMLQSTKLNKQLVYSLLDLCLAELFPELMEEAR